jgi:hypothetical protein
MLSRDKSTGLLEVCCVNKKRNVGNQRDKLYPSQAPARRWIVSNARHEGTSNFLPVPNRTERYQWLRTATGRVPPCSSPPRVLSDSTRPTSRRYLVRISAGLPALLPIVKLSHRMSGRCLQKGHNCPRRSVASSSLHLTRQAVRWTKFSGVLKMPTHWSFSTAQLDVEIKTIFKFDLNCEIFCVIIPRSSEIEQRFEGIISPPSSGWKRKPGKKPAEVGGKLSLRPWI